MNNTQKIKTMRKFFRPYNFEKIEKYLEEMSLKGWHLVSISKTNLFSFTKGEPKKYSYKIDYKTDPYDTESYKQLFNDCGWEYVTHHIGFSKYHRWHFFRKIYSIDKYKNLPEIFSDKDSKIQLYKRIRKKLNLILLPWIFVELLWLNYTYISKENILKNFTIIALVMVTFCWILPFIKFTLKIKRLKNTP